MKFPPNAEAIYYKQLRTAVGMSSTEMAINLGVTRETISRREAGTMKITQEAMLAACYISELAHEALQSYLNSTIISDKRKHDETRNDEKNNRTKPINAQGNTGADFHDDETLQPTSQKASSIDQAGNGSNARRGAKTSTMKRSS